MTIMIIGNKLDLEHKREILKEKGEEKAKSFECAFLETSTFSGIILKKGLKWWFRKFLKIWKDSLKDDDFGIVERGEDKTWKKNKKKVVIKNLKNVYF